MSIESFKRSEPQPKFSLDTFLERAKSEKFKTEMIEYATEQLLTKLRHLGLKETANVQSIYQKNWGELVVRRENPENLLAAIFQKEPLPIGPQVNAINTEGTNYLNATLWKKGEDSIAGAFLEGRSDLAGIVLVEAFQPSDSIQVKEVPNQPGFIRESDGRITDRSRYRFIHGKVNPEDFRFLIMRVPADRFPKSRMTETELDAWENYEIEREEFESEGKGKKPRPPFIFRGFEFPESF